MGTLTAPAQRLAPTVAAVVLCLAATAWLMARATAGWTAWTFEEQRVAAAAQGRWQAAPIQLVDSANRRVTVFADDTAQNSANDIWLVDFIYTRCPSVCQVLGSEFSRLQVRLGEPADASEAPRETSTSGRIRLLSVSVDPAHDGPRELAAYGRLHRAAPAHWTLAVPADADAGATLLRQLGVIVIPDGFGGFTHNGGIHLIDGRGRLRAVYGFEQWEEALAEAQRLARPEVSS